MSGNQRAVARTLRELLEAEQALYRQAQGNMFQLADKVRPAIEATGQEGPPEHRTHLTILSAVAWIAGAALAIPSVAFRSTPCGDPQRDRRGLRRRREPAADRQCEIAQRGHRGRRPGEDV